MSRLDQELREQIRAIFEEIDANARPMQELSIKAIEEDWDEDKFREETVKLIKQHLLDVRKNYDYYTDKILKLFAHQSIKDRKDELEGFYTAVPEASSEWIDGRLQELDKQLKAFGGQDGGAE